MENGIVPVITLGDRMRMALRHADLGVQDIAERLGVARNTVSTWINGRVEPSRQTLMLWALMTEVSLGWLETGQAPADQPGPGLRARRDSNPQPSDP